ncbi:MAG: hypothetical protein RSC93_02565 [Erysipelotrichaceae bacterium]
MKNILKKAGYVSIEVVIVAGVVLCAGIFAVATFVNKGKSASDKANKQIDSSLTAADDAVKPTV